MRPTPVVPESEDLFRSRLDQQINMRHALVRLAPEFDTSKAFPDLLAKPGLYK